MAHFTATKPTSKESELDLLSSLWKEAPFARLPADAPDELYEHLIDIDDPTRVYAIHRAARRHNFQSLVEKYVHQLRIGCGDASCTVSSCFSCRKRLAGKAPIRRYNSTSARTLAIYLASRDNAERGLCPILRLPKDAPDTLLNTLIFDVRRDGGSDRPRKLNSHSRSPKLKAQPIAPNKSDPSKQGCESPEETERRRSANGGRKLKAEAMSSEAGALDLQVKEQHYSKDHRSFSANVFSTISMRMLEWLTPRGTTALSDSVSELCKEHSSLETEQDLFAESHQPLESDKQIAASESQDVSPLQGAEDGRDGTTHTESIVPAPKDVSKPMRHSDEIYRNTTRRSTRRRTSLDTVGPSVGADESKVPTAKPLHRNNSISKDRPLSLKSKAPIVSMSLPEMTSRPPFFENVTHPVDLEAARIRQAVPQQRQTIVRDCQEKRKIHKAVEVTVSVEKKSLSEGRPEITEPITACPLPQSLSRLTPQVIDFLCDVLRQDNTQEDTSQDAEFRERIPQLVNPSILSRKIPQQGSASREQWKLFVEQTLFSVLSDHRSLVTSFTTAEGQLFDSRSLWYCMFRLTEAAPSLVLHCLWMAALALFTPPEALFMAKVTSSRKSGKQTLSRSDAPRLLSICFHGLAALVPLMSIPQDLLFVLSKIRSKGYTLTSWPLEDDVPWRLREKYDDAFSNDLALRLTRRLCCAIKSQRTFSELLPPSDGSQDIAQLLTNLFHVPSRDTKPVLMFEKSDILEYQGNMQIIILDWAKTVVLDGWDGQPDFSAGTPLEGAIILMDSIHKNSSLPPVSDFLCRLDYIHDRLDPIEVPLEWLDFVSTRYSKHLLDYPLLFSAEALVNYFRSINFARMSRAYEEASSLKSRMNAIVDPGSLITNSHHKMVLQDLLKTASDKYLVLAVSRENVLRDAFDQLWRRERRELLRPLKVHLGEESGELGFDSGGVQQEFFRLAIAACLDVKYGAFTTDDRTQMTWFMPSSVVELWKYELMGMLLSLAVFNGLTLPVTFPTALYRTLLGLPVTELHHIEDGWPDLVSGLRALEGWNEDDGAVEDIFARTYEFSVNTFGQLVSEEMTANNSLWPQTKGPARERTSTGQESDDSVNSNAAEAVEAPDVTSKNRNQYISDYVRYLTDVSVKPQLHAFKKGFGACLDAKSLTLLDPEILQQLIEGVQDIDIPELRRHAKYVDYSPSDRTVRDFWSIVKRYDHTMKRKLLEFVTASDRVPVGGVRNIQFVVQRNGGDEMDSRLPTAYTCYGILLLPVYSSKEVMREKLAMALENAQGFGFL